MSIVRVTEKGQVVIPAVLRKKYNIRKGTRVKIEEKNGEIIIRPLLADPVRQSRGMLKGGKSALKTLLADRAKEAKL